MMTLKKIVLSAVVALTPLTSFALTHINACIDAPPYTYETERVTSYFHVAASGFGLCYTNKLNFPGEARYNEIQSQVSSATIDVFMQRLALQRAISTQLNEAARQLASDEGLSLKRSGASLTGPIEFHIQGNRDSTGNIRVSVGGFNLSAHAKFEKSWYAEASASITAQNIRLTGNYNVYTGLIDNLVFNDFRLNVNVDTDTILDFLIPGINLLTNRLEAKFASEVEEKIRESLEHRADNYSKVIFGLDVYLPDGQFYYNGEDLAIVVKNELASLITNVDLKITVGDVSFYPIGNILQIALPRKGIAITAGQKGYKGWNPCRFTETAGSDIVPFCN
ncbi:hypothetical protein FKG94_00950 [Exilibacterium tricleocarpae]|uniref:Lipid-binding serum glycoprotein N-terminal domain-containing protein n=1 Tax=Exilibacterium tricleocarpae TaxID=2591008 RepID=A0A545U9K2_9GAMM|nr:hypothetical protein [Exilibacterium tricleocarpae]TQV86152.1 hypothetical protein FKG94_00950 [Exilibacterium tricleocarpae]